MNLTIAGLILLLSTNLGLVGNVAHKERKLMFVELDALLIIITFVGGCCFKGLEQGYNRLNLNG